MNDLLVDTHVLLWAASTPERLSAAARAALVDPARRIFVSAISAAEIEIKRALGKLRLAVTCDELVASIGAEWLSLSAAQASRLRDLPLLHRDPFDRLLIAQALTERLMLVSADAEVLRYEVSQIAA